MIDIKLKNFQEAAVDFLFSKTTDRNSKPKIVMQSPTGSGKTIILVAYIEKYLDFYKDSVICWFCPGKGELEEQSKEKMERFAPTLKTGNVFDILNTGFESATTYFINWETIIKKDNTAIRDSERKNLFERISEAHNRNLNFIVIIDEEHQNNTSKADDIISSINAKYEIRVSATPNKRMVGELPDAHGGVVTLDPPVRIEALGLEYKYILQGDDVAFHVQNLGYVHDLPAAVAKAGLMDDEVDSRRYLVANSAHRQLHTAHEHHGLEAGQHVARRVRMHRSEGSLMTGIHSLQHVERLGGLDLADDDTVGPHAQRVAHQVANGDGARSLDICGTALKGDDVALLELKLSRVLDGDDALGVRNEARQNVEQRRFTATRSSGNDDIGAPLDGSLEECRHSVGDRPVFDQVAHLQGRRAETSNGYRGTFEGDRRDNRVDARTVFETSVDHGVRLIAVTSDPRHDAVDDTQNMGIVVEDDVRQLEATGTLDIDVVRPVHHNLGDLGVLHQDLKGPEPDNVVVHFLNDAQTIGPGNLNPHVENDSLISAFRSVSSSH